MSEERCEPLLVKERPKSIDAKFLNLVRVLIVFHRGREIFRDGQCMKVIVVCRTAVRYFWGVYMATLKYMCCVIQKPTGNISFISRSASPAPASKLEAAVACTVVCSSRQAWQPQLWHYRFCVGQGSRLWYERLILVWQLELRSMCTWWWLSTSVNRMDRCSANDDSTRLAHLSQWVVQVRVNSSSVSPAKMHSDLHYPSCRLLRMDSKTPWSLYAMLII